MEKRLEELASRYPHLIQAYQAGTVVFTDMSSLNDDCLVLDGRILEYLVTASEDKQASTLLYRPGDFLGPLGLDRKLIPHTAGRAITDLILMRIPDDNIKKFIDSDSLLRCLFADSLVQMLHRMKTRLLNNSTVSPAKRVAEFIVSATARAKSPIFHITTKELALTVSTTRQTVSKVLNILKRRGYVETSYSTIKVLNPDAIRSIFIK